MDLFSASEEECAMVPHDSPSSEVLDDSIVTFGQQDAEKGNFEKIHCESLFEQESNVEEKCHTTIQEELQINLHILQNIQEKMFFAENRACGTKKKKKKQLLWENLMNNIKARSQLRKNLGKMKILAQLMNH